MASATAGPGTTVGSSPWSRMEGQMVLVTGASSGIGRDFCLDLARAGCRVVAAARRTDRLRSLCDEINASASAESPHAMAVELDLGGRGAKGVGRVRPRRRLGQQRWNPRRSAFATRLA